MKLNKLKEILKNKEKSLLFFYADYCDACHETRPIMEQIKDNMSGYNFYNLDIDDANNDDVSDAFKIDYMPTLIIVNENGYKKYEGQRKITKYLESQD
jgi:thiol-disulfide isomerase/thioredoxin